MKALFWLAVGAGMGILAYRYYERNGGRWPMLEQLTGSRTDEIVEQAGKTARSTRRKAEKAVSETASNVARDTMTAMAEDVVEAEEARHRQSKGHA